MIRKKAKLNRLQFVIEKRPFSTFLIFVSLSDHQTWSNQPTPWALIGEAIKQIIQTLSDMKKSSHKDYRIQFDLKIQPKDRKTN